MSGPRISLCIPTYRVGGADVLLWTCQRQTFTDFEVVLVDALWDRRRHEVADKFHDAGIAIVHGPPRLRNFPHDSAANYRNTAIARASGHLLVWIVDYSWMPSRLLEAHWTIYQETGTCLGAPHLYVLPPAFRGGLPWWAPMARTEPHAKSGMTYPYDEVASTEYAREVQSGEWDDWMWSIFHPSITPEDLDLLKDDPWFSAPRLSAVVDHETGETYQKERDVDADVIVPADPKWHLPESVQGRILNGDMIHFKNEATVRESFVQINGFNEFLDGAHSYDDIEAGRRLQRIGHHWIVGRAPITIINVRHYFPSLIRNPNHMVNEAYYNAVDSRPVVSPNGPRLGAPTLWH